MGPTQYTANLGIPSALLLALSLNVMGCNRLDTYEPTEIDEQDEGNQFVAPRYWAMRWITTTVVDIPILSNFDFLATQSRDYYVIEWHEDDGVAIQTEQKCALDISEVVGIKASMPEQFFEYCGARVRTADVDEYVVGGNYFSDIFTLYGAQLDDPVNDALPIDESDPRVEDTDKDSHPGITSIVDGWLGDGHAEVYITQRAFTQLTGRIVSDRRIEGYIDQDVEQHVLGASEGDTWASGDGYATKSDGVPEHNYFIMQALDGPMTCAQMNALDDIDALFEE